MHRIMIEIRWAIAVTMLDWSMRLTAREATVEILQAYHDLAGAMIAMDSRKQRS